MRIHAPDGRHHDVPLHVEGGEAMIDDVDLPLIGKPAAGNWRLEIADHGGGAGRFELWSLRLRTELDEGTLPRDRP